MPRTFRMYVDETGTHGITPNAIGNNRYLSLMGCIVDRETYGASFAPEMDRIKVDFFGTKDRILHRAEIEQRTAHFSCLMDNAVRTSFNTRMTQFCIDQEYTLIAVAIDKNANVERYGKQAWHPYHYCAKILFERYCLFLNQHHARGDVCAESRNDTDNDLLQREWGSLCSGTGTHVYQSVINRVLITHELYFKKKVDNIHGLQLTDMLLKPALEEMLVETGRKSRITKNAFQYVCRAMYPKWHRKDTGEIWQYGKVFL